MARALGLTEIEARALHNVGGAKCRGWDTTGLDDLRRSIDVARSVNSPEEARGHNNLGAMFWEFGDWMGAQREFEEAVRVGEELGNAGVTEYSRIIVTSQAFWRGEWDDALPAIERYLAGWERGDGHYLESSLRADRAVARLARDDAEGALTDVRRAVEHARSVGDPQAVIPTLAAATRICAEAGAIDESRAFATRLFEGADPGALVFGLADVAAVADDIEVIDDVRRYLEPIPDIVKWKAIAAAHAAGDHAGAADKLDELAMHLAAARTRLAAAKRLGARGRDVDARAQVDRALPIFRPLRATRWLREAESLLLASA